MRRWLLGLAFLLVACAGAPAKVRPVAGPPAPPAQSRTEPPEDFDQCEERGRYGDGVCDENCPEVDPDCDPRVALR